MPWWLQFIVGLFGGGLATEIVRAWRQRDNNLARLLQEANADNDEYRRANQHLWNANRTLMYGELLLKIEVNDLCDELKRPHRYDTKHPNGRGKR